jgi:SPP1 family predicted phage head-tail adaptor
MNAGSLRHRVTIQQKAIGVDAFGGATETWTDVVTVWAAVEPMQGRELANAQTVSAETTTKITMRYRPWVIPANRIVFEGKYYNLQSVVDPGMQHRELIIMASEGLNEG